MFCPDFISSRKDLRSDIFLEGELFLSGSGFFSVLKGEPDVVFPEYPVSGGGLNFLGGSFPTSSRSGLSR